MENVILNKMLKEVTLAKANMDDRKVLLKHIERIKLLCELFDEDVTHENNETSSTEEFTEQEIKMMLGGTGNLKENRTKATFDNDDANGDSIFDF